MNRRGFFQAIGGLFAAGVCPQVAKPVYNATTLPMSEWMSLSPPVLTAMRDSLRAYMDCDLRALKEIHDQAR